MEKRDWLLNKHSCVAHAVSKHITSAAQPLRLLSAGAGSTPQPFLKPLAAWQLHPPVMAIPSYLSFRGRATRHAGWSCRFWPTPACGTAHTAQSGRGSKVVNQSNQRRRACVKPQNTLAGRAVEPQNPAGRERSEVEPHCTAHPLGRPTLHQPRCPLGCSAPLPKSTASHDCCCPAATTTQPELQHEPIAHLAGLPPPGCPGSSDPQPHPRRCGSAGTASAPRQHT